MSKASGGTRMVAPSGIKTRTKDEYWAEAKRLRELLIEKASYLKNNPITRSFSNAIEGTLEITYSDVKRLVNKNTSDNKFNAFKNVLAQDYEHIIDKGHYEGYSLPDEGHHEEAIYFAYYSRKYKANAYVVLKKMHGTKKFKLHAIEDEHTYSYRVANKEIIKEIPTL